jgi:hypothetical protein
MLGDTYSTIPSSAAILLIPPLFTRSGLLVRGLELCGAVLCCALFHSWRPFAFLHLATNGESW